MNQRIESETGLGWKTQDRCSELFKSVFRIGMVVSVVFLLLFGTVSSTFAASGDGSGTAYFISPVSVQAGATGMLQLVFTATYPIATRGAVRIVDPVFHGLIWDLAVPGTVTVVCSNPNAQCNTTIETAAYYRPSYVTTRITSGSLTPGDSITFTFTNVPSLNKAYQNVEVPVFTDANGDNIFSPIQQFPRINVLPDPIPSLLVISGPTYVQLGVPFLLSVRILDRYGNPNIGYADEVSLTSSDTSVDLPADGITFPAVSSVVSVPVTLNTLGFQYIHASVAGLPLATSNPFIVVNSLENIQQIFWGDLHGHFGHVYTNESGNRVDEYMEYARDVSDLDFASETGKTSVVADISHTQQEIEDSVLQFDDPGDFVPIRGFEWMGQTIPDSLGHHNIYFSSLKTDQNYAGDDPASDTLEELWSLLDANILPGLEVVTLPHALNNTCKDCWLPCDTREANQRYRPLAEIYSLWGSSETGSKSSVRYGLAYGQHIGFYGSSDTHWALPGNSQPEKLYLEPRTSGLAAIYADTLTREDLWQGFTERQVYATDGARIFLDFSINGSPMGSEIYSSSAPQIHVTAAGTAPISNVEVIKGSYMPGCTVPSNINNYYKTLYSATPNDWIISDNLTDPSFTKDAFYYVRVTQSDGKHALSSPIWVNVNHAPNAEAGGPYSGKVGEAILFDGSGSIDEDSDPLTYTWDFGNGYSGEGAFPNQVYSTEGLSIVTLTVRDGKGGEATDTADVLITGSNIPPLANDQSISVLRNTVAPIVLTGSDPEGQPLIFTLLSEPESGSLSGTLPDLTYTPFQGFVGPDHFTFKVNDGNFDSLPATVSIDVLSIDLIQNGNFESDLSFWTPILTSPASASVSLDGSTAAVDSSSAKIEITNPGKVLRNVQWVQTNLNLILGKTYQLTFWAKASESRVIRVIVRNKGSKYSFYFDTSLKIGTTWTRYELTFPSTVDDPYGIIEFDLGQFTPTVWLDGIELIPIQP